MSDDEETQFVFNEEDHQAAYVFDPDDEAPKERPSKRRRVSKKRTSSSKGGEQAERSLFVPLMDGREGEECVRVRERLFEECWSHVEARIKRKLRHANRATLDEVEIFSHDAPSVCEDKIPSAFIITGPNLASQDLLFEQLQERLAGSASSRFVKLRSSDAANLKATLKKIIRDLTSGASDENEEVQVTAGKSGRRYLDYDLAAVRESISVQKDCKRVYVAIQDSEAFDSTLLAALISVFSNWYPEIPFVLLFGVATSVELLQNRLSKSACEHLYGAEFDVAQGSMGLEQVIIKDAVAAHDVPLRIGPSLLESLVSRQRDEVAGIQAFISSLKYAYMCHFYANPLSVFMSGTRIKDFPWAQQEHFQGIRSMPSFRQHVENLLENGNGTDARHLLKRDEDLLRLVESATYDKNMWASSLLRCVQILVALGLSKGDFTSTFIDGMAQGIDLNPEDSGVVAAVRKLDPEQIISAMQKVLAALTIDDGVRTPDSGEDKVISSQLAKLVASAQRAVDEAEESGHTLRSQYSGQTKVVRTTVIAQRVQLSQDSAALTDTDIAFTRIVDAFVDLLRERCFCEPATRLPLYEIWLYNSRTPYRDVFVPKPRAVFERSLGRPGDYLACDCCAGDGASALAPPAAIVYRLYREAGALINVADLWTAFCGVVGGERADDEDERGTLALFYQGLAELRALGFVKGSKKKTDHIAKVKWL